MRRSRHDGNHLDEGNDDNRHHDDDNRHHDSGPTTGLSGVWLPEAPEPLDRRSSFVAAAGSNKASSLRTLSLSTSAVPSAVPSFSLLPTEPSTTQNVPLESNQNGILTHHSRTPPTVYSCGFSLTGSQKTTKDIRQTSPLDTQVAVTHKTLLPLPDDYASPSLVHGDSMETRPLSTPRFNEFPSDLLGPTPEEVSESLPTHYSWESDDIWPDGNYSSTFSFPLPSFPNNEGGTSTVAFLVNGTESATHHIAAPPSDKQTPVLLSGSVTHVPQKRRSASDRFPVNSFPSNEQLSNREKRNQTKDNPKMLDTGFRCHFGNEWCSSENLCNLCIKDVEIHYDNVALRDLWPRPPLTEKFFWAKWIESVCQAADEITPTNSTSPPRNDLTEVCDRLERLVIAEPDIAHSCCSPAEVYELTGELACVQYARRWRGIWEDSKKQHTCPPKHNCLQVLEICIRLANSCENGVERCMTKSLSYPAIGAVTVQLVDWILLARVVAISKHGFLSTAEWKIIQKLGSHTQGKIIKYLEWIKSSFPDCPNVSPKSTCQFIKVQTIGYIDFILRNHNSDWTRFHNKIQELEDEQLNDDVIAAWCYDNHFDLTTGA